MTTTTQQMSGRRSHRLIRACESAGLTLAAEGRNIWRLSWRGGHCELTIQRGWLNTTVPWKSRSLVDGLARHADWQGPARYEQNGAALVTLSLPVADSLQANDDWALDDSHPEDDKFFSALLAQIPGWMSGAARGDWSPPEAQQIADWLGEAGHAPAIDEAGGLRLTLSRKSCDGQVKIDRRSERFRLTLPLGSWQGLTESARVAMQRLVQAANHRTQLVRHVWGHVHETDRCEAVVDLTGWPTPSDACPEANAAWKSVLHAAVDGLHVALYRLGLELDALADPRHADLVEAFHAWPEH